MATGKFHFNPQTGEAGPCGATVKDCPFGEQRHFPTLVAAREAVEAEFKSEEVQAPLKKASPSVSKPVTEQAPDKSVNWRQNPVLVKFHSDKRARVGEVFAKRPADYYAKREIAYTLHAGKLNPVAQEGSGAEYYNSSENSLVVMGTSTGTGVRVVSSWGEFYKEPLEALGTPINQWKQQANSRDSLNSDLYVLGYVDKEGTAYGYVPNSQVNFFVYK